MRDRSDRYQVQTVPTALNSMSKPKRLGGYLLEAGLLTPAQVHVALNDQQATGMRFGEVLVARGWLKEQTVEWIMQKVIVPDRRASTQKEQTVPAEATKSVATQPQPPAPAPLPAANPQTNGKASQNRREAPISKSLPPVNSSDSDVSWVG